MVKKKKKEEILYIVDYESGDTDVFLNDKEILDNVGEEIDEIAQILKVKVVETLKIKKKYYIEIEKTKE